MSARFTTDFTSEETGVVVFEVEADDGYKFLIDGNETINAWTRNRWGARTYRLNAEKGKVYKLAIEYQQLEGTGHVRLHTGRYENTDYNALLKRLSSMDAIVYVGGISPQLEGEEMRVDYPGFNGGDRTTIMLPDVQTSFLKKLKTLGKPVVFVMMTGSAIAIPWEAGNIPAIINAWYGGQSAGTAIADVLFGDYNPAGRLPVTFYKSDKDLPDFNSYDMKNRTYRYFKGDALYPFGFGLSFTQFKYDQIKAPTTISKNNPVKVAVRVTNSGKMDGEEVVQLYINHPSHPRAPIRAMKGFKRISLKAGESRVLDFTLSPEELSVIGEDGTMIQPTGKIKISIGGGQPSQKIKATSNVVEQIITVK
jgi:beta-glucosidase